MELCILFCMLCCVIVSICILWVFASFCMFCILVGFRIFRRVSECANLPNAKYAPEIDATNPNQDAKSRCKNKTQNNGMLICLEQSAVAVARISYTLKGPLSCRPTCQGRTQSKLLLPPQRKRVPRSSVTRFVLAPSNSDYYG